MRAQPTSLVPIAIENRRRPVLDPRTKTGARTAVRAAAVLFPFTEIDMFDWNRSCAYDDEHKRRFHATARARLKTLASELGLPSGSYDLRSNKGGIAVSGEIILHHDRAYIQAGQLGLASGHGILIRTCNGRRDFAGGANHFVTLSMLDDIPALAAAVRAITSIAAGRVVKAYRAA